MVLAKKLHSKPGDQHFTAWLFQRTIAADLEVTDRAVRTAIAALVVGGHLEVTQRGHHQSAVYRPVLKPDQSGMDFPVSGRQAGSLTTVRPERNFLQKRMMKRMIQLKRIRGAQNPEGR
ncbi:hypothetical protein [Bradyrhizobium sp. DASA03007]|uniref:hypothetical protein n=1 Tax=unclassified Bradyrhizobium TaxID=2631580 RepID=UPI003F7291C1